MAGAEKAIKVKCTAKIAGEERYVTAFQANIGVNFFWPVVSIETHPKKDAESTGIKLGSSDITQEMGKTQKKIFEERQQPDCEVSVSLEGDSSAGNFNFKGFLVGDKFDFSAGNVRKVSQIIPEYALISTLGYSIYKQHVIRRNKPDKPKLKGSLTDFIKQAAEELMKGWQENKNNETKLKYDVEKKQHEINQKVKKYFEQLLQASDGDDKIGWQDAIKLLSNGKSGGGDGRLRQRVMDILLNSDGPFETTIMQIAEEFLCLYVPAWDKIGYYKNRSNLFKDSKPLEIDIVNMSCQDSNGMSLFPIKYVAVVPPEGVIYRNKDRPADYIPCPEEGAKQGGSMLRSHGPLWIDPYTAKQAVASSGKKAPRRQKGCKVDKAEKSPETVKKDSKSAYEQIIEIYKQWGMAEYTYQALSGSTATIVTTPNFKVEVGQCYEVKTKKGMQLFKGVLMHVSHSLATGNGRNPQAYTQLTFGSVLMPGFQLPGAKQ